MAFDTYDSPHDTRPRLRWHAFAWPRGLAWSAAGMTFLLMAGTVSLVWLGRSSPLRAAGEYSFAYQVVAVLGNALAPIIGALIAVRQPRSSYGWIWLASGFALSFMQFAAAYAFHGLLIAPGGLPLVHLAGSLAGAAWLLYLSTGPFVLLYFPNGHLPSPRWRIVVWVVVGALVSGWALGWAMPGQWVVPGVENPYAAPGIAGRLVDVVVNIGVLLVSIAILAGVLSLLLRFRRATGVERQQLKWFTYGAVLLGVAFISDSFYTFPGIWESVKEALAFNMLPPLTIGIAILRYRLYDIDIIIRRTLIYGVLTGILALLYYGSVVLLQGLFPALMGQEQSEIRTVIYTLAFANLFAPLRRWVQTFIDRRFYRRKYDAARILAAFGVAARDEVDLNKLTERLLEVVQETMQPAHVSLWLAQSNAKTQRGGDAK